MIQGIFLTSAILSSLGVMQLPCFVSKLHSSSSLKVENRSFYTGGGVLCLGPSITDPMLGPS